MDQSPYTMSNSQVLSIESIKGPTNLVVNGPDGHWSVTIDLKDGSIAYGEGYKPEVAAKVFWEALSSEYKEYAQWRREHPEHR